MYYAEDMRIELISRLHSLDRSDMTSQANVINRCIYEMIKQKENITLDEIENKSNKYYIVQNKASYGKIVKSRIKRQIGGSSRTANANEINNKLKSFGWRLTINESDSLAILTDEKGEHFFNLNEKNNSVSVNAIYNTPTTSINEKTLPELDRTDLFDPLNDSLFHNIDGLIEMVNSYKAPAFDKDVIDRLGWSSNSDLSDDKMLKKCIELIAYSEQAKASSVNDLVSKGILDSVFINYNLSEVAKLNHEELRSQFWGQIGAIRFPHKLEAMIGCALALLRIRKEHPSFMAYLRGAKIPVRLESESDINEFWMRFYDVQKYLQKIQMPFFSKLTSLCHLLMTLGYPCVKPDSAVMGAAVKIGMVSPESKPNDAKRKKVVETLQLYCLSRNFNIHLLDGYLLIFGGQTGARNMVKPQFYQ